MSVSTILTSKRGFVRSPAFLAAALALAAALPMSAVAEIQKTNPVTGETENYTWKFVGTDIWNGTQYWQNSDSAAPAGVPAKSEDSSWGGSDDQWLPILFDGNTIQINAGMSVEGWNLRMGLYNGANITLQHLVKLQSGVATWFTVDENSTLTIAGMDNNKLEGSNPLCLYSARANGITWTPALSNSAIGSGVQMPLHYYLAGDGSVAFNGGITLTSAQIIKWADVTLSEATSSKTVRSKMLVSFASSSTSTFTADATIKVKNDDGSALKDVNLTSVTATDTTLTTAGNVGDCELVQTTTGILLFYVDYAKTYKPSININFTNGVANGLTTGADVGLSGYEVPGTSWNNYVVANSTFSTVNAIDSTGAASAMSGVSVKISNVSGSWGCSGLAASSDFRQSYIDESASYPTPTVTVSGIPYYKYRVLVYHSTDTKNVPFGYDTINGTNYTYVNDALAEGTTAWGDSGAKDSANAIAEGGNVLVTGELSGSTLTVVGHRGGGAGNARGCIAAIQIVEVKPNAGENDLVIEVSGDTTYTVSEAKTLSGTVYITGSGTLALAGGFKISASTIDVYELVTLNVNADRLDADTFTGGGTVVYDGATPGLKGWADSAWTGTVWIKNVGSSESLAELGHTADSTSTNPVNSWGNAYSFVKFTNVYGYMSGASCPWTLILEDDGDNKAWYDNDGWSGRAITIGGLKGSGTFYDVGNKKCRQNITFTDASAFTGSIHVEGKRIGLGGTATVTGDSESLAGVIEVVSGKTAALASGQTWYAGYRIAVNGTLTGSGTLDSGNTSVAISGSGTVVFDGKAPSPTGDLWWKNAAWTGTVEIKNITDMIGRTSGYTGTYLDFNSYGNADSLIKLGTLTGWMDNYTCNVPVNLAGTLTINNGVSGETFTFKKLISDGGYITATDQSATFSIRIEDGSEYAGYIGLNSKRVIFGTGTAPAFVKGQIYVSSDATITVPSVNTAYWSVGGILVDGELKADNLNRFGGGTNIMTGDNGVFTLTSTGNGTEAENNTDYARIQGIGSLKYEGAGWRALSTNNFPTAMTLVNEQAGDILLSRAITYTIGSLSGSKNFQGNYSSGDRYLRVLQSTDTTWSGNVIVDGSDRFKGLIVAPGVSSGGTLTLSGTQVKTQTLTVESGAKVNLTGAWIGATTVAGTFGGTGTLTGDLTFSDGATFKAFSTDGDGLSVSGAVTFPTAEGESVTVDLSGITPDVSGTTLITAGSINDISKLSVSGALLALENDDTVLKAYPIATLTYTENETTTTIACSSVQDAVNQAYARECQNKTYDYITVYASTNVTAYSATVKVKLANDATFTIAPASPEYGAYSAGSAGEDGVVTYTSATNPTTYTWAGAQEGIWAAAVNWQYGESLPASRYPVAGDTVIINDGAAISISSDITVAGVQVGGAATINGSGTLTAERDGIVLTDADASISVGSVTLSPLPTTTVENAKVKSATAAGVTTYLVAFVYTLTLDGAATTWSGGTWTCNNQETDAPTSGYVEIVARASTELTVDTAVSLVDLNVGGGEDIVVNIATTDTGSLYSSKVTIENGVFQQGSPAVLGATPSIIVEDGATFDMNGLGINAATKVYLAGAGAGSWPWALTSSSGAGGAILGGLYLSANATIGGANELKVGQSGAGYYCYLQGYTLTKIGAGAFTCTNMNTPETGTIDVQGGAMSVNQWNNLNNSGGDTTVILHSGTSLTNGTNRTVPMGTLKLLGGTLTTAMAFKVNTLFVGAGETANLAFANGASASLTGDLTVTAALTLDGATAFSKDENAANDVVVTASGTMSSSGAISVGAGVTLNLGTNRPAATFDVDDDATLSIQLRNDVDAPVLHVSTQPKNFILYDVAGNVVSGPTVAYDSENGTIMISSVNVWTKVKNESFDDGDNWSAGTPPSSGNAAVFVTDTTGITVGNAYTLSALGISGAGDLTISGAGSIAAQTFDFSGATGRVEYNLSTGSADVRSGSNTLILGGGSGTPTVASGQTLTLGPWGAKDGETYTYSSTFGPAAGSTLVLAPGVGRTQISEGFANANVNTTVVISNGTVVANKGGGTGFFGANKITIANGGVLSLETNADTTGYSMTSPLTIEKGGKLSVKRRDSFRRQLILNGGSVEVEGVDNDRALDFYNSNIITVTGDSTINAVDDGIVSNPTIWLREGTTSINIDDGKTLENNVTYASTSKSQSLGGVTIRGTMNQSVGNGVMVMNGFNGNPLTFVGTATIGESGKPVIYELNCEHADGTYVVNAGSRFRGTGSVTGNGGVTLAASNSKLCGSLTVNNLTAASGGTYGDQWNAVDAKVATSYVAAETQSISYGSFTIGEDCSLMEDVVVSVTTNIVDNGDDTATTNFVNNTEQMNSLRNATFSIAANGNLKLEKSVMVDGLTVEDGGTVTLVAASKDSVPALNIAGTGSYNEKVNIVLDFGTARIPLGRTYTLMTGSVPNIDNVVVRDNKSERKWKLSFVGNDLKATSDTWFHIRLR